MGSNSQQRRAAKQRRRQARAQGRHPSAPSQPVPGTAPGDLAGAAPGLGWARLLDQTGHRDVADPDLPYPDEQTLLELARTTADPSEAARDIADLLAIYPALTVDTLAQLLIDLLRRWVTGVFRGGWQPDDHAAIVARRVPGCPVVFVGRSVAWVTAAFPASTVDPRWRQQLVELPGGGRSSPPDLRTIDDRLAATASEEDDEPVTGFRLWLDAPYVTPKAMLVHAVAEANRCRSVFYEMLGYAHLVGTTDDVDTVQLLVASLLVQADRAMLAHGRSADRLGRSRTRSFRQSFLLSFAQRIGERLRRVTDDAVTSSPSSAALVPVLRRRSERVDAVVDELFGRLTSRGGAISNREGWYAGRAAADHAALDLRAQVVPAAGH